ncbi:Zinc finger protein [Plakobranchus ocellatus]|uniref:Zinc finger protein n=1 Tax=Plakobranchus ocellatus TaxID=259542 RepID=A0AAV3ZE01_9GAST|nr:Zinc finger protein [Plakobranchus ocellatus]
MIGKSNSTHASQVVLVKERVGSNRIYIDYRRVNKLTVFDPHPMKPPTDVFQHLFKDKLEQELLVDTCLSRRHPEDGVFDNRPSLRLTRPVKLW